MTFKIELEEQEVDDVIYFLRRMARFYSHVEDGPNEQKCNYLAYRIDDQEQAQKCSLLAFRIENQERAQY